MGRFLTRYAFELFTVALATLVVVGGFFLPKSTVVEDLVGSSDTATMATAAPPTASPQEPPLTAISHMQKSVGEVPYAIDDVRQSGRHWPLGTRPSSITVERDASVTISGWAIGGPPLQPATAVFITLGGRVVGSCRPEIARPDVATALKLPAIEDSGFSCEIPVARLLPGRYALGLDIATLARTYHSERTSTALIVR